MTTPVVATTATSNETVNTLNHTVNMPASIASGDLLIACIAMDGNTTLGWPAGWTGLAAATNSPSDGTTEVRYRIADGSEGASITVTSGASEQCSYVVQRITGWHGTTPPEAGTPATGSSTAPDPPSLTASWGAEDNLFMVFMGWGNSIQNITVYPTNYSDNQLTDSANSGNCAGFAFASRALTGATDNPGAATLGATSTWVANTLVVRPAAAVAAYFPRPVRIQQAVNRAASY